MLEEISFAVSEVVGTLVNKKQEVMEEDFFSQEDEQHFIDLDENSSKKKKETIENKVKKKKTDDLEEEIEEAEDDENAVGISYSFEEEHLFSKLAYGAEKINYSQMFYGDEGKSSFKFTNEDEYWSSELVKDTQSEMLSATQAEKTFKDIQYAAAGGARFSVSMDSMRKMDLWIKFNPALFGLFQSLHAVTKEVDYAPPR